MFAILGSGFGLYGYLPALVSVGETVVLPERYRQRFDARKELAGFASRVRWVPTETEALGCASGAVVALRPADQRRWLPRCLAQPKIGQLFLEKPLAPTPALAASSLEDLVASGKAFRIGYTFQFTPWAAETRNAVRIAQAEATLWIEWSFLAHHFLENLHNWKRVTSEGGGAIRFYGIHLIAFLAELGYRDVRNSVASGDAPDEIERWSAVFVGNGLPDCRVSVDTRSAIRKLRVGMDDKNGRKRIIVAQDGPFDASTAGSIGDERRIPVLKELVRSLRGPQVPPYAWYETTNSLWYRVERETMAQNQ